MRRILCLVLLLFSCRSLSAQTVEDQLREMRAEIQRLRQEVDALKQELKTNNDVVQDFPLVQAQVQEQAQTKVESSSKFPLKLYGTIVSNTFWNSGEPNWIDLPNLAGATRPGVRPGSFSSIARQTRIGAILEGPTVSGMKLNGNVAIDFFGGFPNFENGQVFNLPRLLYGYMRLDSEKTGVEIGMDQMILAPKNPTSLVDLSFPAFYRSGNLYLRAPQIRAERQLASGDYGQLRVVGGIVAPIAGDFPETQFQFEYDPFAGERSRTPGVQSRLSWRAKPAGPYEQPNWEFGVSGSYGRQRFPTGTVPSWATAFDFDANAGKFGVGGEYFIGRNVQAFGGSIAQLAKSQGGWMEGRFAATQRLSFNGGYGTDRPYDLVKFPVSLTRNGTFFANTIYNFTPEFRGGFEYQRLATKPVGSSINTNNHFNLSFAYSF